MQKARRFPWMKQFSDLYNMSEIFKKTSRPNPELFFSRKDKNDPRMGEIVTTDEKQYDSADIVILGCPQDEGVKRNHGRAGAATAPDAIREQFYKLTPMGIKRKLFDLGDIKIAGTLEEIHDIHAAVVEQVLRDGKRLIIIGGGNDISYPDGKAMAAVFGPDAWIGINVDSHLDVRADQPRNSGTPYRQLLEEGLLLPGSFYEVGYQSHFCSPVYYNYLKELGVNRISLEVLRSHEAADQEIKDRVRLKFINQSSSLNTFFGFDIDALRSADAPGTSAPSPLGLRAGEFITLVKYAASLANTKIIEFTEVNPNFDIDNRTTKLVAIGIHRFCSHVS